jgi:hypothetical protein
VWKPAEQTNAKAVEQPVVFTLWLSFGQLIQLVLILLQQQQGYREEGAAQGNHLCSQTTQGSSFHL